MAYTKQTWADTSSGSTPLSAARLAYIEDGIEAAAGVADTGAADATTAIANAATAQGAAAAAQGDADAAQATADAAVAKSTATTKGDLLVATGAAVVTRLGVGTDGRMLEADSVQGTGVKWGRKITVQGSAPSGTWEPVNAYVETTSGDIWLDNTAVALPALDTQSIAHSVAGGVGINMNLGHTAEVTLTADINAAHSITNMVDGDVLVVYYLASGAEYDVAFGSMNEVAALTNPGTVAIPSSGVWRATFIKLFGSIYLLDAEVVL